MTAELRVVLDAPLPAELAVGAGTVVLVAGRCDARGLRLLVGGEPQPVLAERMPRFGERSGFWGLAKIAGPRTEPLTLGLRDADGAEAELGTIPIRTQELPLDVAAPGDGPLVAVCMATHEPPQDLLERQLESIRAQTHTNWVCVISDDASSPERFAALEMAVAGDARFVVSRSERRLGFFGNFERALELAPADAGFVALADQDDAWHPDKLATLLGAIGSARLAYSDARVVSRDGTVIAEIPSSSPTIGAKANTISTSLSATWLRVKCGSPSERLLHTKTMAVQGAAASRIKPAM